MREYKLNKKEIKLYENINVFYGENAQGKTNILEAIFISGTTKSHKGSKDLEVINDNEFNSSSNENNFRYNFFIFNFK